MYYLGLCVILLSMPLTSKAPYYARRAARTQVGMPHLKTHCAGISWKQDGQEAELVLEERDRISQPDPAIIHSSFKETFSYVRCETSGLTAQKAHKVFQTFPENAFWHC